MNSAGRHRSTRDRPAKLPLSEDVVVEAALAILRSEGLDAVTMRRVATALDTGAASLYVYVSGREGLLQAIQDRIVATVELEDPDASRWRAQLHTLLVRLHRAFVAHPGIAAMAMAEPPTTQAVLHLIENLLGILFVGGLDAQDAAWASDIFVLLATAAAVEADVRGANPEEHAGRLYDTFTRLPADQFPLITAHAAHLVASNGEQRLSHAIDIAIDGMLTKTTGQR